jgi:hypothetical protein
MDYATIDALKLCVEAIEILHPELDPKEPCVVYNAWNNAKKLLERAEPVPAKPTRKEEQLGDHYNPEVQPDVNNEWEKWAWDLAGTLSTSVEHRLHINQLLLTMPGVPKAVPPAKS